MFKDEHESSRITDFQSRKKANQAMWQTLIETQGLDMEDNRDELVMGRKRHCNCDNSEGFSDEIAMVSTMTGL